MNEFTRFRYEGSTSEPNMMVSMPDDFRFKMRHVEIMMI